MEALFCSRLCQHICSLTRLFFAKSWRCTRTAGSSAGQSPGFPAQQTCREAFSATPHAAPVWCRDAEDSVRGRDGYDFYGNKLRVELAKGGARDRGGPIPMPPGGFRNRGTGWRVIVKGLPMSASWQDLKVRMQARAPRCWQAVLRGCCARRAPAGARTAAHWQAVLLLTPGECLGLRSRAAVDQPALTPTAPACCRTTSARSSSPPTPMCSATAATSSA